MHLTKISKHLVTNHRVTNHRVTNLKLEIFFDNLQTTSPSQFRRCYFFNFPMFFIAIFPDFPAYIIIPVGSEAQQCDRLPQYLSFFTHARLSRCTQGVPNNFINKKNHCLTVWSSHYYSQRTDGHGFETLSLVAYSIMYVRYNQHKC